MGKNRDNSGEELLSESKNFEVIILIIKKKKKKNSKKIRINFGIVGNSFLESF